MVSGLLGFYVAVHLARHLGSAGFGHLEFGAAVVAWILVLVRSGVEQIVFREAARRPRLIGPLTDALIGLKGIAAAAGFAMVLTLSPWLGRDRAHVLILTGVLLFPAALIADVGPRALGQLTIVAISQLVRGLFLVVWVVALVKSSSALPFAALGASAAELAGGMIYLFWHSARYGLPRPRVRPKVWRVLAHRGLIASITRFARVWLYGADVIVLGCLAVPEYGSYAAARRIVFALVALGLVVPTAFGSAIARAWASGAEPARRAIARCTTLLIGGSVPAAIGLILTARFLMPRLFGSEYARGSIWLELIAGRLPLLLLFTLGQTALVACRRENAALRLTLLTAATATLLIPPAAITGGPTASALCAIFVEAAGLWLARRSLLALNVWPSVRVDLWQQFVRACRSS
jgi:O-antigen/teichoic acid export membrane protein